MSAAPRDSIAEVSVAMCTHNGAAYVEEQLRSILGQSIAPTEVVISDDASSDDTLARVQAMWDHWETDGEAPTLRILRNQTALGVTRNFEQALAACTGEFIALCDQDDRWHDDRIERAVHRFVVQPELLLLHADAVLIDERGASLGASLSQGLEISEVERIELTSGNGFRALLRRNLVTGATAMVRRELIAVAAPFPEPWVHDEWLAMVASATGQLDYLPEALIDYRQHGKNQIGVRKLNLRGKIRRVLEPRNDRNSYLLERAQVLLTRLEMLGDRVPAITLELARGKVVHHQVRAALSNRRWQRLIPVLREATTGRYSRYSRGMADILRDLLQPA
jgi:glycosyltransferase involved in cell wall biosynthesis